jgi:hypothetical protein
MTVHYSSSSVIAISELVDIPSTSLKRRRYSECKILGISQFNLAERPSREHSILSAGSLPIKSKATLSGKSKRLRKVTCEIKAKTEITISDLLVLPIPVNPTGKLILGNLELNKLRLKTGLIHNLIFEVHATKIAGMQLEFEVKKLDGTQKLYKTLNGVPGGIYDESITELESKKIQIGTIPILRDELNIDLKEQEFLFTLKQSNDLLNLEYEIVSGMFTVYKG